MLQSPQNVTKATIGHFSMQMTHLCYKVHKMYKATIGYIIWVRGSDVDHYALYKVHIEDVTKSTFMLQRPLLKANDTFML